MARPKLDPKIKSAREIARWSQAYLYHMDKKPEGAWASQALEKLRKAIAGFPKQ